MNTNPSITRLTINASDEVTEIALDGKEIPVALNKQDAESLIYSTAPSMTSPKKATALPSTAGTYYVIYVKGDKCSKIYKEIVE